jgi:hypothetical protein
MASREGRPVAPRKRFAPLIDHCDDLFTRHTMLLNPSS